MNLNVDIFLTNKTLFYVCHCCSDINVWLIILK